MKICLMNDDDLLVEIAVTENRVMLVLAQGDFKRIMKGCLYDVSDGDLPVLYNFKCCILEKGIE